MSAEFQAELDGTNYFVPSRLTSYGRSRWPDLLHDSIRSGDDETLFDALAVDPALICETEMYERGGILRERRVNAAQAARMLATSEFNTIYVRGLSAKLLSEGVESVEIYRAGAPLWSVAACTSHEGLVVATQDVYDGHRARYWPTMNPHAFSVPFHSGCHHSIRRVQSGSVWL